MRSFLILGFLAATASAGVLPGYKYGPGISGVRQEIVSESSAIPASLIGEPLSYNNAFGGSYINGGVGIISSSGNGLYTNAGYGNLGSTIITTGNYKQSGSSGNVLNIGYDALDSVPQTVEYSKQFYHFDAPAEAQTDGIITRQLSNNLKKNLQVVFIKAPENNAATNAALQLAKQAVEQKTAIYVLSKQQDAAQLVGQLQQIQENVQTKPEVRFVKYRTPEDVVRAKASIQSQYDNFGGISESYNGGVAPVLNYASAAKPYQFIFGGPNRSSGKYYESKTGNNFNAGSTLVSSAPLISSGSNLKAGATIVSSTPLISSGSSFKSGSTIVSSTPLFSSGSNFKSGSNIVSSAPSTIVSSPLSIESGSNSSESISSIKTIASESNSVESGPTEFVEIADGLDSSSNAGATSFITTSNYLPPFPLKK